MAAKKDENKGVSTTLATGTKVTAPQSVIDKVTPTASREAEANSTKSGK